MNPAQPPQACAEQTQWPRIRRILTLEPVAEEGNVFPCLIIGDPVRGKFFKVGWPLSGLILVWNEASSSEEAAVLMQRTYGAAITPADLGSAMEFLAKNELSETDEKGGWQRYKQAAAASRHGFMKSAMHNYLFFRIPLLHPDAQLKQLLPYMSFAFRAPFWTAIALIAATGLYLSTRQWSAVVEAFYGSLHFQQVFLCAAALFLLKAIHELGHALTTVYYGCRVPSMGIAFMLGAPVLYTDTTDSWRLSSHRQRLAIVFAGVAAESIVAALALLAWPLLPEGPARHMCFSFATAALAMSLAVNLNPFMRFDGYFALSDYWRVPNLQTRSFALATWKLREVLFGLGLAPPEPFARSQQGMLIAYAYCVWIYRFFLFLGIAYIVYVMAGKAIGIVLGLFELAVFILWPIWHEVRTWWSMRSKIVFRPRAAVTAAAAGLCVVLAASPCLTTVESPGVLVAGEEQELHLPAPAKLIKIAVREGQQVAAGDQLFEAVSPDLDNKLRKAKLEARLLELRLSRLLVNKIDHEQTVVLKRESKAAREKVAGIERERKALRVTAPFAGRIADFDNALAPGVWVSQEAVLGRLTGTAPARVKALIADTDLQRVANGARGVFVADEADMLSQAVVLETIAPASDGKLAEPALSDLHGGPVPSTTSDKAQRAREGWIEVAYATSSPAPARLIRGVVRVEAEAKSPLSVLWRQIGRVLVREQGF